MTILLTWSDANGGANLTEPKDHGSLANGATSSASTIFVRHDGTNPITEAGFFIRAASGTYSGSATAAEDIAELLSWGDAALTGDFGGFQLALDALATFPAAEWPTFASKTVLSGGKIVGVTCRTGVGDCTTYKVPVITEMGCTADNEIQAGGSPNVSFACRMVIPAGEGVTGIRLFDQVLAYNYTS